MKTTECINEGFSGIDDGYLDIMPSFISEGGSVA